MLGFGILAVLGLPFIFWPTAQRIPRHHSRWLRRAVVYRLSHVLPSSAQPHSAPSGCPFQGVPSFQVIASFWRLSLVRCAAFFNVRFAERSARAIVLTN